MTETRGGSGSGAAGVAEVTLPSCMRPLRSGRPRRRRILRRRVAAVLVDPPQLAHGAAEALAFRFVHPRSVQLEESPDAGAHGLAMPHAQPIFGVLVVTDQPL